MGQILGTVREGSELVTNGGMESGNPPSNWSNSGLDTFEQSSVQRHSGTYSMHCNDSNPNWGMACQYKTYDLAIRHIKISFWYYLVSGSIQGMFYDGVAAYYGSQLTTIGSWQYVEWILAIAPDGTEGYVGVRNHSNSIAAEFYIDDVSVVRIDEPELIYNGTMETGDPPTGYTQVVTPTTFERSGTQKHSGSYSCHIVGDSNLDGFQQTISKIIGKKYKVSFWYYLVSGALRFDLRNGDDSNSLILAVLSTTGAWTYYENTATETVSGSTGGVRFLCSDAAAEFYIDDVSVQEYLGEAYSG